MTQGTKASPRKDSLTVEEGPINRSQVKRVKEAMRLLVKDIMDETLIVASKGTSYMLGLEAETRLPNLIQAADERLNRLYYAIA